MDTATAANLTALAGILKADGRPVTEETVTEALAALGNMHATALSILNPSNADPRREQFVQTIGREFYAAATA